MKDYTRPAFELSKLAMKTWLAVVVVLAMPLLALLAVHWSRVLELFNASRMR